MIGTTTTILLGAAGVLTLPALLLLAVVAGCGTVVFEVAYQSFLPAVVARERLDAANSRLQATEATALVAGPGVSGLLVQLLGALPTLAVTAVGSLMSAASLSRISESFTPATQRKKIARDLLEGLRFLRRDRVAGAVRRDVDVADIKALIGGCISRHRQGSGAAARDRIVTAGARGSWQVDSAYAAGGAQRY